MSVYVWLGLLILLLVAEAMTAGLTTIWFAGGAVAGGIAAYLGAHILVQLVLFAAVSGVLLLFTRPLVVRYMNKTKTATNVESLKGEIAVVIQEVDDLKQTGKVRINDIEWLARTGCRTIRIPEGRIVRIKDIQGVKLIVEEVSE